MGFGGCGFVRESEWKAFYLVFCALLRQERAEALSEEALHIAFIRFPIFCSNFLPSPIITSILPGSANWVYIFWEGKMLKYPSASIAGHCIGQIRIQIVGKIVRKGQLFSKILN